MTSLTYLRWTLFVSCIAFSLLALYLHQLNHDSQEEILRLRRQCWQYEAQILTLQWEKETLQ